MSFFSQSLPRDCYMAKDDHGLDTFYQDQGPYDHTSPFRFVNGSTSKQMVPACKRCRQKRVRCDARNKAYPCTNCWRLCITCQPPNGARDAIIPHTKGDTQLDQKNGAASKARIAHNDTVSNIESFTSICSDQSNQSGFSQAQSGHTAYLLKTNKPLEVLGGFAGVSPFDTVHMSLASSQTWARESQAPISKFQGSPYGPHPSDPTWTESQKRTYTTLGVPSSNPDHVIKYETVTQAGEVKGEHLFRTAHDSGRRGTQNGRQAYRFISSSPALSWVREDPGSVSSKRGARKRARRTTCTVGKKSYESRKVTGELRLLQMSPWGGSGTSEYPELKTSNLDHKALSGKYSLELDSSLYASRHTRYSIIYFPTVRRGPQADFSHGFSIEVQEYTPGGRPRHQEKILGVQLGETGLAFMKGFRYDSLHLPTAFIALQGNGEIGSPRVIVEISSEGCRYIAFSIRTATLSLSKSPITIPGHFSRHVPEAVIEFDKQFQLKSKHTEGIQS